jgi:hypothetical protein
LTTENNSEKEEILECSSDDYSGKVKTEFESSEQVSEDKKKRIQ